MPKSLKPKSLCVHCNKSFVNLSRHKCKPKGKPESDVKKVVKDVLTSWGAYYFMPVQTGMGQRTLDFIVCVPVRVTPEMVGRTFGAFVGIETKREGISTPTPKQAHTIQSMRCAGGSTALIHSTHDLEVEEQILNAIKLGCEGTNFVTLGSYIEGQL